LLLLVAVGSQKYRKILILSYFHVSTCGQIWLNHFRDDSHLGYITKLEKETLSVGAVARGAPNLTKPFQRRRGLCENDFEFLSTAAHRFEQDKKKIPVQGTSHLLAAKTLKSLWNDFAGSYTRE